MWNDSEPTLKHHRSIRKIEPDIDIGSLTTLTDPSTAGLLDDASSHA